MHLPEVRSEILQTSAWELPVEALVRLRLNGHGPWPMSICSTCNPVLLRGLAGFAGLLEDSVTNT